MLQVIDTRWLAYLTQMDHLREGMGFQAYGQMDPAGRVQGGGVHRLPGPHRGHPARDRPRAAQRADPARGSRARPGLTPDGGVPSPDGGAPVAPTHAVPPRRQPRHRRVPIDPVVPPTARWCLRRGRLRRSRAARSRAPLAPRVSAPVVEQADRAQHRRVVRRRGRDGRWERQRRHERCDWDPPREGRTKSSVSLRVREEVQVLPREVAEGGSPPNAENGDGDCSAQEAAASAGQLLRQTGDHGCRHRNAEGRPRHRREIEVLGRDRSTHQVALSRVAAEVVDQCRGRRGFQFPQRRFAGPGNGRGRPWSE